MIIERLNLLTATASELSQLLDSGSLTSVDLVHAYLKQISEHDGYLKAVISVASLKLLLARAELLDKERGTGKARSRIHGIPILLKDNIGILQSSGLDTTAGSLALVDSKPKKNAVIVDKLLDAGAIILGKTNLWEFSGFKSAYSAVGGFTQSAYVRGGIRKDDIVSGHSYPSGSSSGSAVSVSAGYSPFSLGTDTAGSVIGPASRAALYAMKPTIGLISNAGIVPHTKFSDGVGPMAKSAVDVAMLLDILVDGSKTTIPNGGYLSAVNGQWEGLRMGTLDPELWAETGQFRKVLDMSIEEQITREVHDAYVAIEERCPSFSNHVPLITTDKLELEGVGLLGLIFARDFKIEFEEYLETLDSPKVHSLAELIQFNKDHAEKELPTISPSQENLERAEQQLTSDAEYLKYTTHFRGTARKGIDRIFKDYDVNVIVGPSDSDMNVMAAASGYPIATLPLGYLDFNGRPHGLSAITGGHQESLLVQLQSAWEASFPKRKPPPLLEREPRVNKAETS